MPVHALPPIPGLSLHTTTTPTDVSNRPKTDRWIVAVGEEEQVSPGDQR